jgi:hypothetical protein
MFLKDKEPDDTEAIEELNKYCSTTLYKMKNKLLKERETSTYRSLLDRGQSLTVHQEFNEWMVRLKDYHSNN